MPDVIMVEDNARFTDAVGTVMRHSPGWTLRAAWPSAEDLFAALHRPDVRPEDWDVVLMDLDLPGMSGIDAIRRLKARHPTLPIVVCSVAEDPPTILAAISVGADGYLLKNVGPQELLDQLSVVLDGGSTLSAPVARTVLDVVRELAPDLPGDAPAIELTDREQQVLRCLVEGMSYKIAADALGVSVNTIRSHIRSLYRKLQVQNVAEAVSVALRRRLV